MVQESFPQQVQDLGEHELLERLQRFCPADVVGDDAAVLSPEPGQKLVVTTDMLVDGVHFSLGLASPDVRTTSPEDVGWRAAAANLSDLAAMGATPLGLTVALGLPGNLPFAWVEGIYRGLTACLKRYDTVIVGGDICRSSAVTLGITALGQVDPAQAIRRSSARVGDAIAVTGFHGASRAGLELLLHPEQGQHLSPTDRHRLIQAHQRPLPRLDASHLLQALRPDHPSPESSPLTVAGMDSSDGLADAVIQICRASQVGAILNRDRIPIPTAVEQLVAPQQALNWALYGGEDFELVLCLPPALAQRFVTQLGHPATIIGTITDCPEVRLTDPHRQHPDEILRLELGFQHF